MEIFVAKDGQQLGPYDTDNLTKGFANGAFSPTDLAWTEGEVDWIPLSELASKKGISLNPASFQKPPIPPSVPRVSPQPPIIGVNQDSRNLGLIIWIGTIFFGFIPGLIFFLTKKEDPFVYEQSKEALNWCITAIIGYFAGLILTFILIGILVLIAVGIGHLVFCIMGAIAASKGNAFRVPFCIRLIK